MRTRDSIHKKNCGLYGDQRFAYPPESNTYLCPEGKQLTCVGVNLRNRTHLYKATAKRRPRCSPKAQGRRGLYKTIAIHIHEPARQHARELAQTPAFEISQPARKKVEALFAELKNQIGMRRLRLRRMK